MFVIIVIIITITLFIFKNIPLLRMLLKAAEKTEQPSETEVEAVQDRQVS